MEVLGMVKTYIIDATMGNRRSEVSKYFKVYEMCSTTIPLLGVHSK